MLRSTIPAALLTVVLVGCAGDTPTAPLLDASALDGATASHQATPQRPIKGECDAETIDVQPIAPGVIRRVSVGTCQLSHLGRTGLLSIAISNLVENTQVGEHTYTAANGDLLFATSVSTSVTMISPTTLRFTGVTTISGGTGRFALATGVMQASGVQDLATSTTALSYDGWISY